MRCIIPLIFPPAVVVPQPDSPTFSHLRLHLVFPPSFFVALASPPRPPHSLSLSFRLARHVRQSGTAAPPPESATSVGFSVAATTDDYTVNACEKQVQAKHEQVSTVTNNRLCSFVRNMRYVIIVDLPYTVIHGRIIVIVIITIIVYDLFISTCFASSRGKVAWGGRRFAIRFWLSTMADQ